MTDEPTYNFTFTEIERMLSEERAKGREEILSSLKLVAWQWQTDRISTRIAEDFGEGWDLVWTKEAAELSAYQIGTGAMRPVLAWTKPGLPEIDDL